jgi:hypothetical protein
MKKVMTGGLVALLLAALVVLLSMASIGSAAPTSRQYNNPVLTLSVSGGAGGYYMFVQGAGYAYDPQAPQEPIGTFTLTCTKGTTCADAWPSTWGRPGDFLSPSGTFSWYGPVVSCPSNVKSAIATDPNGVKSNSVKGPC